MSVQNNSLRRIYKGLKDDHTFESLEDFIEWSTKHGHKTLLALYKLDTTKPHGPENSYWYLKDQEVPDSENALCLACSRKYCPGNNIGCKQWRDAWIKNWNENICIKPKEPEPRKREVFWYEHPDLVREGIVFEGSRSV